VIEAIALGTAQDGGVPHAGCRCPRCSHARAHPGDRPLVASLGLLDRDGGNAWIIDATPDFTEQLALLHDAAPECRLRGILLTHGHVGHYTGLVHLGREVMDARGLSLYGTASMLAFLAGNAPWRLLIERGNLRPRELRPGRPEPLAPGLAAEPVAVPHRAEATDTVAFLLRGARHSLFYCPDLDRWEDCRFDPRALLGTCDTALVDGTFFDADELHGATMSEVPHPSVRQSLARFAGLGRDLRFTHLNHSNPLLLPGPEREEVERAGFRILQRGDRFTLA
jgi:pyrroloquinoline quinone biosynthesis protein B